MSPLKVWRKIQREELRGLGGGKCPVDLATWKLLLILVRSAWVETQEGKPGCRLPKSGSEEKVTQRSLVLHQGWLKGNTGYHKGLTYFQTGKA